MWKTPSTLVAIVLILLALGIVMLASTSSVEGQRAHHDAQYFLKRQFAWLFVAAIAAIAASSLDYHRWQQFAIPLFVASVILLLAVFLPGIGTSINGSHRWLHLGPLTFQPSELGKLGVIVGLSAWMAAFRHRVSTLKYGLLLPGAALAIILGLIFREPDFGTTMLVAMVGMAIMFVGGTKSRFLLVCSVLGFCAFALAVLHNPVRMGRILAFVMPDRYPEAAYQLGQSKDAFIMGGAWGVGFGQSIQKHFYLPEAYTDFILSIIGEELGLAATAGVVLLFLGLLFCGLAISFRAPDMFGRLLGFGITTMISLQAAVNIGVVTGCLPTKGLALPFISYGGSSLMMSLIGIGVLVNIARHAASDVEDEHTHPIKDQAHWL